MSKEGYDSTVDWWSLGCVFYEMLIGRAPYKIVLGDSLNEELYNERILIPDYVTDEACDLIKKLLIINPKKRLGYGEDGAKKIKQHPYFKDVNWDNVWKQKIEPPFIPNLKGETDLTYFDTNLTNEKINSGDSDISGISLNNNTFKGFTYVGDSFGNEMMVMNKSNDDSNNK